MFIFDFIFGLAASAKNFIFYGGLIIAALFGLASLGDDFSSFTSRIYYGYPAADRKPTFTVGKYDEKDYNWKLFGEAKDTGTKVFYDMNTVSLDDKNGIATVLMKVQRNKGIDLYRMVLRYDTPQNEMLITDVWSNTNKLPKNYSIAKVEKDSAYGILWERMHKDLEIRKKTGTRLSIDEYIAAHSKVGAKADSKNGVQVNTVQNKLYLANGKIDFLNSEGKYVNSVYVVTDNKVPLAVSKLEEKVIKAEDKSVVIAKSDFDATLLSSTRDNIQKLRLRAGQKYSVVNAHLGRYTLQAKDASGKTVLVVTNVNQLIVPEDKKIIKISFNYKGVEHITWVDDRNLQNTK